MAGRRLIIVGLLAALGGAARAEMHLGVLYFPFELTSAKETAFPNWYHALGGRFAWGPEAAIGIEATVTYARFDAGVTFDETYSHPSTRSQLLALLAATSGWQLGPARLYAVYGGGVLREGYTFAAHAAVVKYYPAGVLGAGLCFRLGRHVHLGVEPRFIPVLGDRLLGYPMGGGREPAVEDGHGPLFGVGVAAGYVF